MSREILSALSVACCPFGGHGAAALTMPHRILDATILRPEQVTIAVNGAPVAATPGESVATALLAAGMTVWRRSPRARTPRGAFCLMGVCQECIVRIDGRRAVACQESVRAGLIIELDWPQ